MPLALRFSDPIGPGTPAWSNFDKAVAAWRLYQSRPRGDRRAERRRYYNLRNETRRSLQKAGRTDAIPAWMASLVTLRDDPDFV